MPGVGGSHHVLGIEHLLRKFRNRDRAVLLAATGSQWRKANHEEVETGEGD